MGTLCFPSMIGEHSGPPPTAQGWVPARPATPGGSGAGAGLALGLVGGFVAILVLVFALALVIVLTMGGQIANVSAALG